MAEAEKREFREADEQEAIVAAAEAFSPGFYARTRQREEEEAEEQAEAAREARAQRTTVIHPSKTLSNVT